MSPARKKKSCGKATDNRGDSEQRHLQAMWEQNQEKKKNGGGGNEHGSAPKRQSTQQNAREDKASATLNTFVAFVINLGSKVDFAERR